MSTSLPPYRPLLGITAFFSGQRSRAIGLKSNSTFLRVRSFSARIYGSALEFIAGLSGEWPDCLIVDFQMPGIRRGRS